MESLAYRIQQLLVAAGEGGDGVASDGWTLFCGFEPSVDGDSVTVYDVGGQGSGYMLQTIGEAYRSDHAQIRVRCGDYRSGFAKAAACAAVLENLQALNFAGVRYLRISSVSSVLTLERDEKERTIWVTTVRAFRQALPGEEESSGDEASEESS